MSELLVPSDNKGHREELSLQNAGDDYPSSTRGHRVFQVRIDRTGAGVCCAALAGVMIAVHLAFGPAGDNPAPGSRPGLKNTAESARWASDWMSVASQTLTSDGHRIDSVKGGTRACRGRRGAVTATNFEATQAGLQVLAAGGNAADAAVAVQLMLGVAQPESTGIGGGSFIMYYDAKSREAVAIDGREEAPARFHPHIFCSNAMCGEDSSCMSCPEGPLDFNERYTGGLAVGVPGTLAAAGRLLSEFGTRSMAEVAAPAIERARNGITMTHHLYSAIRGSAERLQLWNASAALFLSPHDRTRPIVEVGERWFNRDLAAAYERIANHGVEDFYIGTIARDVINAAAQARNPNSGRAGVMDFNDIAGYRAVRRVPTRVEFNVPSRRERYEVVGMSMPSSGGTTLAMMLNMLETSAQLGEFVPLSYNSSRTSVPTAGVARLPQHFDPTFAGLCEDDPDFLDEFGSSCSGWAGYDCQDRQTALSWGYTVTAGSVFDNIVTSCPASCGICVPETVSTSTRSGETGTGYSDMSAGWAPGVDYTATQLQLLTDMQNIVFADRNKYMGDADFVRLPLPPDVPPNSGLLSKQYAADRWNEFAFRTQGPDPVPWGVPPDWNATLGPGVLEDDHGTTHFVIVDKDHNVASWTSTIESNMGSSVVVPGRGFLLNNELTDFDATAVDKDGNPNANGPNGGKQPRRTAISSEQQQTGGKRPRSSMSPTIVLKITSENDETTSDGDDLGITPTPLLALGSPGGSWIIGAVLNTLVGRLVHGLPVSRLKIVIILGCSLRHPTYRVQCQHVELCWSTNWFEKTTGTNGG